VPLVDIDTDLEPDEDPYTVDPALVASVERSLGWTREQFLNRERKPPLPPYPASVIPDLTDEEAEAFSRALEEM
jgi:hypothetical protein